MKRTPLMSEVTFNERMHPVSKTITDADSKINMDEYFRVKSEFSLAFDRAAADEDEATALAMGEFFEEVTTAALLAQQALRDNNIADLVRYTQLFTRETDGDGDPISCIVELQLIDGHLHLLVFSYESLVCHGDIVLVGNNRC